MSYVREKASTEAVTRQRNSCELRRRSYARTGAFARGLAALGVAASVLWLAPVACGQGQNASAPAAAANAAAQNSATAQSQTQGQSSAQGKAQSTTTTTTGASAGEPQMVDQSAPQEQSLGAIARQAKAQKAKTDAAKVFTEDKLSGLSGRGVSSVGSGSAGGSGAVGGNSYSSDNGGSNGGAAAGGGAQSGNGEAYWRGRANAIRGQMAQLDEQIAGIQEEIKKKGAVTVDPMSGAAAGVIYVEDRNKQIQQVQAQKDKLQQQLEDLAEEGRKAGADSGWFR